MEQGTIKKEGLKRLVEAVGRDTSFYGPVWDGRDVVLAQIGPSDDMAFGYGNFLLPAKRQFFPWCETISRGDGGEVKQTPLPDGKKVMFGLRPCDARSLLCLDKVFVDDKFVDPYYRSRRESALIVSLACTDPLPTCFCTSVGGNPAAGDGADIVAFELGCELLFEVVTHKGRAFMAEHCDLFGEPGPEAAKLRNEQVSTVVDKLVAVKVDGIAGRLEAAFESQLWDDAGRRCLGCGVCTYACPTCHCFGFHDETSGESHRRTRVHDACLVPGFTLEASGHDPRSSQGPRMRQRIMHKFNYTVKTFGDVFCVGCGRCIAKCPVNIDLRETLAEVMR